MSNDRARFRVHASRFVFRFGVRFDVGGSMFGVPRSEALVSESFDPGRAFLSQSRQLLTDSYLPRIDKAIAGLSVDDIWWRANSGSNSIGNLILHLDGNVRQWIVSGLGGHSDVRERRLEFEANGGRDGAHLVTQLTTTVHEADDVLSAIDPATLGEARRIQSYDVVVMRAVYTVIEHFSMHTGQIILIAKQFKGDLGLYDLSSGNPRPTWTGGVEGH